MLLHIEKNGKGHWKSWGSKRCLARKRYHRVREKEREASKLKEGSTKGVCVQEREREACELTEASMKSVTAGRRVKVREGELYHGYYRLWLASYYSIRKSGKPYGPERRSQTPPPPRWRLVELSGSRRFSWVETHHTHGKFLHTSVLVWLALWFSRVRLFYYFIFLSILEQYLDQ